jgi:hypothetical protein
MHKALTRPPIDLCSFYGFCCKNTFFAVCTITGATIVGLLFRPMRLPEAVWACLGALVLILLHLISWDHTLLAVSKGVDVYLFLAGMMYGVSRLIFKHGLGKAAVDDLLGACLDF